MPPVVTANPSIDCANSVYTNGRGDTYQLVSGCTPSAANAFAHLSVHAEDHGVGQEPW